MTLNILDLFSGIGGFSMGLERTGGFKTIAFCEIEKFPRAVLRKHWPDVPIFEDVRKLHATDITETVDVICGGYPCQPFSLAGKRQGADDDRHLWPEIARLLRELDAAGNKPAWCVFENVAGHINMGLDQVLADLESQGYTAWPVIIPACAVDAPHRRDRVWIVAHAERTERLASKSCGDVANRQDAKWKEETGWIGTSGKDGGVGFIPNTERNRLERRVNEKCGEGAPPIGRRSSDQSAQNRGIVAYSTQQLLNRSGIVGQQARRNEPSSSSEVLSDTTRRCEQPGSTRGHVGRFQEEVLRSVWNPGYWPIEPAVGRVAHGLPRRVDRLRALGNAVVPQVVEVIGRAILAAHYHQNP